MSNNVTFFFSLILPLVIRLRVISMFLEYFWVSESIDMMNVVEMLNLNFKAIQR